MSIANTFPVFEPDQVLTNKHLNDMFNYLDEQDRLTRCKLLGSGVVCGLDISHTATSIAITKGCGLTTQGYIIMLCDHTGDNAYKYYRPYSRPPFPKDLQPISQCGDPDTTNILFYGETFNANNLNNQFLLLTPKDVDALTDKTDVNPISKLTLDDYAVVLFLEATETSLKNCDTNDCNDKGSVMDFEVKPLLIYKPLLQGNQGTKSTFQPIDLRRYNVPAQTLKTSEDVLNAFVTIVEALPLKRLAADLEDSFTSYKSLLTGINTNPFGSEADFKKMLDYIMKNFPYLVQYFYDFIYDLTRSLYEFRYRLHEMTSACCGDEMLFPFHLTLGEASVDTPVNGASAYRQYFIYSPLFDPQGGNRGEARSLLMRMILMYRDCFFTKRILGKNDKLTLTNSLRITPSTYGRNFISERCIPYYYSTVAEKGDAIPANLYYYWNYDKTRRGNAAYNLSYNAYDYNKADSVVFPLYYDIEWYDFFRIEGFIGNNIDTVLTQLKTQQQNFNLPFDIAALSADYIGALVKGEEPKCSIQDLESDYRVLIAGFVCQLHDPFCNAANKDFATFSRLTNGLFAINTENAEAKATAETAGNLADNRATVVTEHPFISGLVNEFQALGSYVKGTMLQRLCQPASGTMGRYYIDSLAKNGGKFVNPFKNTADSLDYQLMQFIDSVETMFQMLMDDGLDTLDTGYFKGAYLGFEINGIAYFDLLMRDLRANTDNEANREEIFEAESDEKIMLNTCITEKLDALKTEYNRRMAQYRLAKNFAYYFKQHGGVEHKAGVPRGGTFILVYHEERGNRRADASSLLVNSDMGKLLLSEYRDLLNPDTGLDTLEAKTKMLAVTTLYKDPTLYLKFKEVMQQYLDACDDLPADKRTAITAILNQPPPSQTFDLTDGMVIADFYVPYMCCSDCPPVAYILPASPLQPKPLTATASDPVCDATGENFTTQVTATGGTAPYSYSYNGITQTSGIIILPSGAPDTNVTVTDASGATFVVILKGYACPGQGQCNLPCKGIAENCKYILWLPRPADKDNIVQQTKKATLSLTDETGKVQQEDVTAVFNDLLDKWGNLNGIFAEKLGDVFDELNKLVSKALPGNDSVFTYNDDSQTLSIEQYTCQAIALEIEGTLIINDNPHNFKVLYANNAFKMDMDTVGGVTLDIKVAKFDCINLDKCNKTSAAACKDKPKIDKIAVQSLPAAGQFGFSITSASPFDTWVWYFDNGTPLFSTIEKPVISFPENILSAEVRIWAINSKTGCFATLEQTINIRGKQ